MDMSTDVGGVRAESQLDCSAQSKPSPLYPERHETGTQHRCCHVKVQVRHLDIWLPEIQSHHSPEEFSILIGQKALINFL